MQPEGSNVPAFLNKLWNMVNEPYTDHLISWSSDGKSFIIQNQAQFWYDLLPQYYKHNNMSSFVRQLNMYGFHKKSSVENATMDTDKDEIQFFHPYFQKGKQELLKNIKRKVTGATRITASLDPVQSTKGLNDLTKVLSDVKALKGKQASVDSQLMAMKHENAVLWRELAVLRQKHMTQQKIVNKLIQFLVTIVQPTRMGGLGVKRHYQLMLNDVTQAQKKSKGNPSSTTDGPTIHELDSSTVPPEDILIESLSPENIMVQSPSTSNLPSASSPMDPNSTLNQDMLDPLPSDILLQNVNSGPADSNEDAANAFMDVADLNSELLEDKDEEELTELLGCNIPDESMNLPDSLRIGEETENNPDTLEDEKVFLNPTTQDTLLSNLVPVLLSGNYNPTLFNGNSAGKSQLLAKKEMKKDQTRGKEKSKDTAVATRDSVPRLFSTALGANGYCSDDLDLHLESMQSELDQLKDILNGYNNFDANALLGLFSDESLPYELSFPQDVDANKTEELTTGSELAPLGGALDFSQLLDDSSDITDNTNSDPMLPSVKADDLNTPQISLNSVPVFPSPNKGKNKTK